MSANREKYLQSAIDVFAKGLFKLNGYGLPEVKVSVGFPFGRCSKKIIGQHWVPEASDDLKGSIFISPTIDDTIQVLAVLIHELVHASVGNQHGHGGVFKQCALAVGLTGPMTETLPGDRLAERLRGVSLKLGPYPHSKLNLNMRSIKKQTTRMVKMECPECGYIARTSWKNIAEAGPVFCPCNKKVKKQKRKAKLPSIDEKLAATMASFMTKMIALGGGEEKGQWVNYYVFFAVGRHILENAGSKHVVRVVRDILDARDDVEAPHDCR